MPIKPVSWSSVKNTVQELLKDKNEALYTVLCDVADKYKKEDVDIHVHQMTLGYGDLIVDQKKFTRNTLSSFNSQLALRDEDIPDDLKFCPVPLGLLTQNGGEIFDINNTLKDGKHHAPLKMLFQGDFLGVFETVDYIEKFQPEGGNEWSIQAGARSVLFNFPLGGKRGETAINRALELLNKSGSMLRNSDLNKSNWNSILNIQNSLGSDWTVDVIFFPQLWFDEVRTGVELAEKLSAKLLKLAWKEIKPVLSSYGEENFLEQWHHNELNELSSVTGNNVKKLGLIAYDLYCIDQKLKPAFVDCWHAMASEESKLKLQQLVPFSELATFYIAYNYYRNKDANYKYGKYYPKILIPLPMDEAVKQASHSLYARDGIKMEKEKNENFYRRLLAIFGFTKEQKEISIDLKNISVESILLLQSNVSSKEVSIMHWETQFKVRDIDENCDLNIYETISESGDCELDDSENTNWYQNHFHHKIDTAYLGSFFDNLHIDSKNEIKEMINGLDTSLPVGDQFKWLIHFQSKI